MTIAQLNDKFRKNPYNGLGKLLMTRGLFTMPNGFAEKVTLGSAGFGEPYCIVRS